MIKTTEIRAEHFIVAGYHYDTCYAVPFRAYNLYIWVPCLAFDTILTAFAVWAGVKNSRKQSKFRPTRFTPQLEDILIQGNVIYFLKWAFSCHIGWNLMIGVVLLPQLLHVSVSSRSNGLPMPFSSAHQSWMLLVVVWSFQCERPLHTS